VATNKDHGADIVAFKDSHANTPEAALGANFHNKVDITYGVSIEAEHVGHINEVHSLSYGDPPLLLPKEVLDELNSGELASLRRGTGQFWNFLSLMNGDLNAQEGHKYPLSTYDLLKEATCGITGGSWTRTKEHLPNQVRLLGELHQECHQLLLDMSAVPIFESTKEQTARKST
jgi:hypothetical protein